MIYEYYCECGETKEVDHGMLESPKVLCKCKKQMKKVITGGTGFVLKGDGWPGKEIKSGVKKDK